MEEFKIKNKDGLELIIHTDHREVPCEGIITGGLQEACSWNEYLNLYKKEYHQHFRLIKLAFKKLGWIGETAEMLANQTSFTFSDGSTWGFTWRAWGDLMQAIVNKKEGYMRYYM